MLAFMHFRECGFQTLNSTKLPFLQCVIFDEDVSSRCHPPGPLPEAADDQAGSLGSAFHHQPFCQGPKEQGGLEGIRGVTRSGVLIVKDRAINHGVCQVRQGQAGPLPRPPGLLCPTGEAPAP